MSAQVKGTGPGGKVTNVDLANHLSDNWSSLAGPYKSTGNPYELEEHELQVMPDLLALIQSTTNDIPGFLDAWNMLMSEESGGDWDDEDDDEDDDVSEPALTPITVKEANKKFPAALKKAYADDKAAGDDDFFLDNPKGTFKQWLEYQEDNEYYLAGPGKDVLGFRLGGGPADAMSYWFPESNGGEWISADGLSDEDRERLEG